MISAWLFFFLEGSTTCDNNWDRLPAQGSEQGDGFLAPSLVLSSAAEPSVPSTTQTSSAGTGWLLRNPKAKDFSSFFTEKSSLGNEHVWGTEVVLLAASFAIKGFQKSITASFGGVLALLKKKKTNKMEKKEESSMDDSTLSAGKGAGKLVAYKQLAGRHQLNSSNRERS